MVYNFSEMKIGDKAPFLPGDWSESHTAVMELAHSECKNHEPPWQFQADGYMSCEFSRGQFWLWRIR